MTDRPEDRRPNVVLIMTDQQRWDTLSCLGFDHVPTPNIDRLASRGVAFSHAFVQGAVCGPSRNSIVSGQYVHTHGIYENECWLTPDRPNWIEQLRDGGYHTVNIGKMHTAPIRLPCGFNHRTVVENKNYRQGHHGPDPDDYDLVLADLCLAEADGITTDHVIDALLDETSLEAAGDTETRQMDTVMR